jgi:hypothetical protein
MNTERLLREVGKRLSRFAAADREEVLEAIRDEVGRERRRLDPAGAAETERERRVEAETLREILEVINRQSRLTDTTDEVLKQVSRLVVLDSCSLALAEPDGGFRIVSVRGFPEPSTLIGLRFQDALTDSIRQDHFPIALPDVQADPRFLQTEGTERIRSWAGIPLLVEGDVIGLLALDRHALEPFDEDDLHRAKTIAFSAAATIRHAQAFEQVRRYASLMEELVSVDQAVFAGRPAQALARTILLGALKVGNYAGGLLVLEQIEGPRAVAATGAAFAGAEGRLAPPELLAREVRRLDPEAFGPSARALGIPDPEHSVFLVPFQTADNYLGAMVLLDPGGETPEDRMIQSYASRAAAALLHTLKKR